MGSVGIWASYDAWVTLIDNVAIAIAVLAIAAS